MRWGFHFWKAITVLALCVAGAAGVASAPVADVVTLVDVLVLRSPAVARSMGGAAVDETIRRAVVNANLVLQNSGVPLRFRLLRIAPINYVESGMLTQDLLRLRTPGDGQLDEAHTLRETTAADLVCLVVAGGDRSFAAAPGPSAANAFSVIRADALDEYLAAALAANFGCQPERASATAQPALPFAYGHILTAPTGAKGTAESMTPDRVNLFSNPRLTFDGVRAGVPAGAFNAADNTLAMSLVAPIVAAFRGLAPRTLPPVVRLVIPAPGAVLKAGSRVTFQAEASDTDGRVTMVEFVLAGPGVGLVAHAPTAPQFLRGEVRRIGQSAGPWANSASPVRPGLYAATWQVPTRGDYSVQAVATDDRGATTATTLAVFHAQAPDATGSFSTGGGSLGNWSQSGSWDVVNWWPGQFFACAPPGRSTNIPPNDAFADRIPLPTQTNAVSGTTLNATAEPGEPPHAARPAQFSVWYSWTAPADGRARFWAASADNYPRLAVYSGEQLTNLLALGSAISPCGMPDTNVADAYRVEFPTAGGVTYAVAVDSANGGGTFTLNYRFAPRPANDDFANRTLLSEPSLHTNLVVMDDLLEPEFSGTDQLLVGTTFAATKEAGEPAHAGNAGGASVWWSWTAPRRGRLNLNPGGTSFSPLLAAYTGFALGSLLPVAANTGGVEFPVASGTTYALALDGQDGPAGGRGDFSLALNFFPSPFNDDFAFARPRHQAAFSLIGDTHAATREPGEPDHGDTSNTGSEWWRWTAPASGNVKLTAAGLSGPLALGAYVGGLKGGLWTADSGLETLGFWALRGVTYQIAAAGPAESDNPFTGSLQGAPAPPTFTYSLGDARHGRLRVKGLPGQSFGIQTQAGTGHHQPILIETLQSEAADFVVPRGNYVLVPLEDLLLTTPLRLLAMQRVPGGAVLLQVTGRPGQPFALQVSENVKEWQDLQFGSVVGDRTLLTDASAAKRVQRFYRVRPLL